MARILGLILNGGTSRRFGAPKAEALLEGKPLIGHVADRLAPQVEAVAVAGDACGLSFPALDDAPFSGAGPLAGIHAGLDWAAGEGAVWLVSAPCDVPCLPVNLVEKLLAHAVPELPCAIRREGRLEAACALWPVSHAPEVRRRLRDGPDRSLKGALADAVVIAAEDASFDGSFENINRPEDLASLKHRGRPADG